LEREIVERAQKHEKSDCFKGIPKKAEKTQPLNYKKPWLNRNAGSGRSIQ